MVKEYKLKNGLMDKAARNRGFHPQAQTAQPAKNLRARNKDKKSPLYAAVYNVWC